MSQLTDRIPDSNSQYSSPSGAPAAPSFLTGLAKTGEDIMQAAGIRDQRALQQQKLAQQQGDEAALNQFALGTINALSTPAQAPEGFDLLDSSGGSKLNTALSTGAISRTQYDTRMQGLIAQVAKDHPDSINKVLAYANAQGYKGFMFRDAEEQQSLGAAALKNQEESTSANIKAATEAGLALPGVSQSYLEQQGAALLGVKYKTDLDIKLRQQILAEDTFTETIRARKIKENDHNIAANASAAAALAAGSWLTQLTQHASTASALGDTPEDTKRMSQEFSDARAQLNLLQTQYKVSLNAMHVSKDEQGLFDNTIDSMGKFIDQLEVAPGKQRTEFLKTLQDHVNLNNWNSYPALMTGIQTYGRDYFMQMMNNQIPGVPADVQLKFRTDFLAQASGLAKDMGTEGEKAKLWQDANNGNVQVGDTKLTKKQQDDLIQQSQPILAHSTSSLNQGTKDPAVGMNFKTASVQIMNAARQYSPADIFPETATKLQGTVLNDSWTTALVKWKEGGGDPVEANRIGTRAGVVTAQVIEGLATRNQGKVTYNAQLQRFVGVSQPVQEQAFMGVGEGGGVPTNLTFPGSTTSAEGDILARQMNALLDNGERLNQQFNIVPASVLKDGNTIRNVLANQPDLIKAANADRENKQASADQDPQARMKFDANRLDLSFKNPNEYLGAYSPTSNVQDFEDYTKVLRGHESGGDNNAKPFDSTAFGPDQFLGSTWLHYAKDMPWAEGKTKDEVLAMRSDPKKSEEVLKEFTADNAVALHNAGVNTGFKELHMAHFAGATGAIMALHANDTAKAATVLASIAPKKEIKEGQRKPTNWNMFYQKDGTPKTIAEFKAQF